MKRFTFYFILVSVIFYASLLSNCNINSTRELLTKNDSINIVKALKASLADQKYVQQLDKTSPALLDDLRQSFSFQYTTKSFSEVIAASEATPMHIRYLESPGQVLDENRDIIHYFTVSKENLVGLYEKGKDSGMRIYLGKDENNKFSLMLVPVKADGDNDKSYIVDKLEPCPDRCMKNTKYTDENNVTDLNCLNDSIWFKPNLIFDGKKNQYFNKGNSETRPKP